MGNDSQRTDKHYAAKIPKVSQYGSETAKRLNFFLQVSYGVIVLPTAAGGLKVRVFSASYEDPLKLRVFVEGSETPIDVPWYTEFLLYAAETHEEYLNGTRVEFTVA